MTEGWEQHKKSKEARCQKRGNSTSRSREPPFLVIKNNTNTRRPFVFYRIFRSFVWFKI